MSGPGDDMNDSPDVGAHPAHPATQHAVYRRACSDLMRQREEIMHRAGVNAMRDAARLFDATVGWCGLCPAGNRETCRCGPDGCADGECPGMTA